ncbi:hypothetical protein TEQG_07329 [Trichophyton equinum CBS 127.97]|uniref:Uncharacterized protein n=1 Tax=Trichophyton equinum (strain ATCC MYA-4606 / CBS 127.97) TaxID=559882 RepID=F2Q2I6_TRIEC|nr:hypothetical protein TEQG_07329 [Trichophyton equinum CBS 127.97]
MACRDTTTNSTCQPSTKSIVAKATVNYHSSESSAESQASTSLTESTSIEMASSPSVKSSSPVTSGTTQGKSSPSRLRKVFNEMEKKSPEEIAAYVTLLPNDIRSITGAVSVRIAE